MVLCASSIAYEVVEALMYQPDPKLDLVLERTTDISPEQIFRAWTTPDLIKKWFAPKPWQTTACEIDVYAGGKFATTMKSPDGDEFPGEGCILEVIENRKLVWTSALIPGYRPSESELPFTAVISMEPTESGAIYRAIAIHGDEETCKKHSEMGFHDGWGQCFDQLVELVKTL